VVGAPLSALDAGEWELPRLVLLLLLLSEVTVIDEYPAAVVDENRLVVGVSLKPVGSISTVTWSAPGGMVTPRCRR